MIEAGMVENFEEEFGQTTSIIVQVLYTFRFKLACQLVLEFVSIHILMYGLA